MLRLKLLGKGASGQQQTWCCIGRINGCLSLTRKDLIPSSSQFGDMIAYTNIFLWINWVRPWKQGLMKWLISLSYSVTSNLIPAADHYGDVIMGAIASQITSLTIVFSIFYSDADKKKHQSSASLAFVRGIHRFPVNSPHKRPVTRKMFPFDDIIM